MSLIDRGGQMIRPRFRHQNAEVYEHFSVQSQMLESIRNCLEQIRDSQMLSCAVRADINKMALELSRIRILLARKRRKRRK